MGRPFELTAQTSTHRRGQFSESVADEHGMQEDSFKTIKFASVLIVLYITAGNLLPNNFLDNICSWFVHDRLRQCMESPP